VRGQVISGPHLSLFPGQYSVILDIKPLRPSFPLGWIKLVLMAVFGAAMTRTVRDTKPDWLHEESRHQNAAGKWKKSGAVAIEIRSGKRVISRHRLSILDLASRRRHKFPMLIADEDFAAGEPPSANIRVWSGGQVGLEICGLDLVSGEIYEGALDAVGGLSTMSAR
jgi:hypothetical protein